MKSRGLLRYIWISFFIVSTSCVSTEKEYFENGNLSSISYTKRNSSNPYLIEKFSEEGLITSKTYFDENGELTGSCYEVSSNGDSIVRHYSKYIGYIEEESFFQNGEMYHTMYVDDQEHGVARHFKDGNLSRKGLFYNGQLIAYDSYDYHLSKYTKLYSADQTTEEKGDSVVFSNENIKYAGTQYRISGTGTDYHTVGNYFFRSDTKEIDNRYSTYFIMEISDRISNQDSVRVEIIGNYRFADSISFDLWLGGLDTFEALSGDQTGLKHYLNHGKNRLAFSLSPQESGYHFLVGSVFLKLPGSDRKQQFIVFDDFVVE